MPLPILMLDFDGVCHRYDSGWKGAAVIPDPAVDGLFEFLEAAKDHFDIQVFSSRSHQEGGTEAMLFWFYEQRKLWRKRGGKPPIDTPLSIGFPTEKPPAMVGLDDRVLLFTGKWPTVQALRDFQPWGRGGKDPADDLRAQISQLRKALQVAINTVECASIDHEGNELPWYVGAKAALRDSGGE